MSMTTTTILNTRLYASLLFVSVIVSQLSNIIYEKLQLGEEISVVIFPSLLFLSLLTIPSLLIGFKLGKSIGLSLNQPHLSYPRSSGYNSVLFAVVSSILLGIFLLVLRYFSLPYLPEQIPQYGFRGVTGGLLVSIGAAIGEEIWFRFGLMTLLLWLLKYLFKLRELTLTAIWSVMLIVAITFGTAHIPQLMAYGAGSNFAIWGTMLGNISVSFLYGWCYWRYGLMSAIIAHFCLDIVLHVLPALL
jgi:membrane protease YdiL (CAAX protease family)